MTALEQAHYTWERREYLDEQGRLDAAIALAEWGVFSARQISAITGVHWWKAAEKSAKTDRTGGRLNPETLPDLMALSQARARGEMAPDAARRILEGGTTATVASRLTNVPETTLKRWAARVPKEEAA